jgi:hypothetical protein
MSIEKRPHLALRLILDALIGLELGMTPLTKCQRNRGALDDLQLPFRHGPFSHTLQLLALMTKGQYACMYPTR